MAKKANNHMVFRFYSSVSRAAFLAIFFSLFIGVTAWMSDVSVAQTGAELPPQNEAGSATIVDPSNPSLSSDDVDADGTSSYDFEDVGTGMEDMPIVRIRILNKITALTRTYNIDVNKAVAFDSLNIQPRACRKAPPVAKPESAAFMEIWETPPQGNKPEWIFSGWMFASSPGLSAMDHPVYDVWVLDCLPAAKVKAPAIIKTEDETTSDSAESDPAE